MSKIKKYGLRDLRKEFKDDDVCLDFLFQMLHSNQCSCKGVYRRIYGRKQYQCSKCRFQIAPTVGTIFEKSSTPLTLWFHAIFIFSNAKSGISAKEMERQLNVTYKTAWRMLSLIRKALNPNKKKLKGIVEVDEAHIGGSHSTGAWNEKYTAVREQKIKVIAAQERGGDMKAKVIKKISQHAITSFVRNTVEEESVLMTDSSRMYSPLEDEYARKKVNHSQSEYVRDDAHVNNVENFWSHFKTSLRGTFKHVSSAHFQSYVDSFVWLRNNRHNDRWRFVNLIEMLATGGRL